MGKIYPGKPMKTKNRKELIASLKPKDWQYLRADNGDMPVDYAPSPPQAQMNTRLHDRSAVDRLGNGRCLLPSASILEIISSRNVDLSFYFRSVAFFATRRRGKSASPICSSWF